MDDAEHLVSLERDTTHKKERCTPALYESDTFVILSKRTPGFLGKLTHGLEGCQLYNLEAFVDEAANIPDPLRRLVAAHRTLFTSFALVESRGPTLPLCSSECVKGANRTATSKRFSPLALCGLQTKSNRTLRALWSLI